MSSLAYFEIKLLTFTTIWAVNSPKGIRKDNEGSPGTTEVDRHPPQIPRKRCTTASLAKFGGLCKPPTSIDNTEFTESNYRAATHGYFDSELVVKTMVPSVSETRNMPTNEFKKCSFGLGILSMNTFGNYDKKLLKSALELI
ncbi:hypothetical protein AYI69_g8280 [Smittium culicis]|uniref:Uncharacterized protein n=1 Tax=Smittium culicis TaxID=133412 RepID=A0A1R1X3M0_9FUNG|nr:hypothetical protein AYI69_g10771 [Smittium culicis]OMJ15188.1 hypothetical protein AYI69_g8280 [Smittium culicis]